MGKITRIKRARKERRCNKCGAIIHVGDSYLKGEINFHPDIVRCTKCGLQSWEVTTSDYQLSVGAIVNNWESDYGCDESTIESVIDAVQEVLDETEDKFYNLPESLQYALVGETLQERIDSLESAISDLESIDVDSLKDTEADNMCTELYDDTGIDFDTLYEKLQTSDPDKAAELVENVEDLIREEISSALNNLEY